MTYGDLSRDDVDRIIQSPQFGKMIDSTMANYTQAKIELLRRVDEDIRTIMKGKEDAR